MDSNTYRTGEDLKEALDRGCIENCRECGLKSANNKCLLKTKEQWQIWADEEHKRFSEVLDGTDQHI